MRQAGRSRTATQHLGLSRDWGPIFFMPRAVGYLQLIEQDARERSLEVFVERALWGASPYRQQAQGSNNDNSPLNPIKSTVVVLHDAHMNPVFHLGMKSASPLVLTSMVIRPAFQAPRPVCQSK
jgi:hypothetical protein